MKRSVDQIFRLVGLTMSIGLGLFAILRACNFGNLIEYLHYHPMGTLIEILAKRLVGLMGMGWTLIGFFLYLCAALFLTVIFSIAFWLRTKRRAGVAPWINAALLLIQVLIGLMSNPELLVLVALELPLILPLRAASVWFGAMSGMLIVAAVPYLVGMEGVRQYANIAGGLSQLFFYLMLQTVFFIIGFLAAEEKRRRAALAAGHARLSATQSLLADAVRASERVRISHDVNDALGHHLTALNLQLELALTEAGSEAIDSIKTARELARHLLAEVREAVSMEQEEQGVDLRQALTTLCSGIPSPAITLSFDGDVEVFAPAVAHAAFRSVQEATSNAVRHSGAALLHIALSKSGGGLAIDIGDNGRGAQQENAGNGLSGIRERVEELGGKLAAGNRPEGGFGMHIWLPLSGDTR